MTKYYIYGRFNNNYGDYIKVGITSTPIERNQVYITGEMERGRFTFIIEFFNIDKIRLYIIDRMIKKEFEELRFNGDGGTEFYHKNIENNLLIYLDRINVKYNKLTEENINNLHRKYIIEKVILRKYKLCVLIKKLKKYNFRLYKSYKENILQQIIDRPSQENIEKTVNCIQYEENIIARPYQEDIIEKTVNWLQDEEKGILVEPCGIGKTIIALLTCCRLCYSRILIGVPSLELLSQWYKTTQRIFPVRKILKICKSENEYAIENFLIENNECVVIVMYQSTRKIKKVCNKLKYIFDIKIPDEVHHITSSNVVKAKKKD